MTPLTDKPYVMVLDDEPNLCSLLSSMLTTRQVQVIAANSIREANEFIHEKHPCLLFLDNKLPDGLGIDFLSEVKAKCPGIPVVMITGDYDADLKKRAMEAGCRDFLEKPFSYSRILSLFDESVQVNGQKT